MKILIKILLLLLLLTPPLFGRDLISLDTGIGAGHGMISTRFGGTIDLPREYFSYRFILSGSLHEGLNNTPGVRTSYDEYGYSFTAGGGLNTELNTPLLNLSLGLSGALTWFRRIEQEERYGRVTRERSDHLYLNLIVEGRLYFHSFYLFLSGGPDLMLNGISGKNIDRFSKIEGSVTAGIGLRF